MIEYKSVEGNPKVRPLVWTEVREPDENVRYHHVIALTPFGRFLITWKGWKKYDSPTLDETPWGDYQGQFLDLEEAKSEASRLYAERVLNCIDLGIS